MCANEIPIPPLVSYFDLFPAPYLIFFSKFQPPLMRKGNSLHILICLLQEMPWPSGPLRFHRFVSSQRKIDGSGQLDAINKEGHVTYPIQPFCRLLSSDDISESSLPPRHGLTKHTMHISATIHAWKSSSSYLKKLISLFFSFAYTRRCHCCFAPPPCNLIPWPGSFSFVGVCATTEMATVSCRLVGFISIEEISGCLVLFGLGWVFHPTYSTRNDYIFFNGLPCFLAGSSMRIQ